MKKSSVNTKNILSEVNHILGIKDSYQAPDRVLALVTGDDKKQRDKVYYELAELFGSDYSRDWFWEYFQEEHADRRQNKQDFTPPCIASVIHNVLHDRFSKDGNNDITYDPAAGTGQLVIRDWWLSRKGQMPWEYKPMDHLVVCAELSVKTIPFLLLNLSIRGICGMVFHANSMTNEIYQVFVLVNEKNDPLRYSDVTIADKTIFKIQEKMRKKKVKEKQCTICGEMKPLSEFYTYKYKGRTYTRGFCNACDLRRRRERYREKHPGGLIYDKDTGKLWLRKGRGRSLVWTSQMLSDLRRLFARTKNEELAGILGVGMRTMVRKARELGLEKDGEWLSGMWRDHVRMAHMMSRAKGYPGGIKKGEHRNPDGEYKAGRVHSEEERRKISEGNRRNWMLHKRERRAKIRRTRGLDDEEKTAFVS